MLFDNVTKHTVSLPARTSEDKCPNISYLVTYLLGNLIKDPRKELFVQDGTMYVLKPPSC
jgi:ubiquitin related modifier 1